VSPNVSSLEGELSGDGGATLGDLGGGLLGDDCFGAAGALVGAGADSVAGMVVRLLLCS